MCHVPITCHGQYQVLRCNSEQQLLLLGPGLSASLALGSCPPPASTPHLPPLPAKPVPSCGLLSHSSNKRKVGLSDSYHQSPRIMPFGSDRTVHLGQGACSTQESTIPDWPGSHPGTGGEGPGLGEPTNAWGSCYACGEGRDHGSHRAMVCVCVWGGWAAAGGGWIPDTRRSGRGLSKVGAGWGQSPGQGAVTEAEALRVLS